MGEHRHANPPVFIGSLPIFNFISRAPVRAQFLPNSVIPLRKLPIVKMFTERSRGGHKLDTLLISSATRLSTRRDYGRCIDQLPGRTIIGTGGGVSSRSRVKRVDLQW